MKHLAVPSLATLALLSSLSLAAASPKVLQLDVQKPQRRSASAVSLSRRQNSVSVDLANAVPLGNYLLNISVGTPAQTITVVLDTGSSDLWVAAKGSNYCQSEGNVCDELGSFDPASSSSLVDLKADYRGGYGDGTQITAELVNDTVAFGNANMPGTILGVVKDGQTNDPLAGIMGIGYQDGEAIVQTSGDPGEAYPNIVAQLKTAGLINTMAYSLWLNDLNSAQGSILFGGVDTDKFNAPLVTLPVTPDQTGNFSALTVAWTSLSFSADGQSSDITTNDLPIAALLDSGTTETALPDDLAQAINQGLGVVQDQTYGSLLPCSAGNDSSVGFTFGFGGSGGASINVAMYELLLPVVDQSGNQVTFDDGTPACQFTLQGGAQDGEAILGDAVLRSAYVVYDLDNNQIGLAQTKFNVSSSNVQEISGSSLPGASAAPSTITAPAPTGSQATALGGPVGGGGATVTGSAKGGAGGFTGSPTFGHFNPKSTGKGSSGGAVGGTNTPHSGASGFSYHNAPVEMATLISGTVALLSAFGGAMFLMF